MKIIGTCGICGGDVAMPSVWHGVYPPTPSCNRCGAIPRTYRLPVLDMEQPDSVKVEGRWFDLPWKKMLGKK